MTIESNPDLARVVSMLLGQGPPIVFFVGAGLSKPLGLPSWKEMLAAAADHGRAIGRLDQEEFVVAKDLVSSGEYLRCGRYLRDKLGIRLDSYLREIFDGPLPSDLGAYEYLIRLPSRGFITTNYDNALEMAYSKHYRQPLRPIIPHDFPGMGDTSRRHPFLLKLHGDATRGQFVVSDSDYAVMLENASFQRYLYSLFFNHTIVFLGYGLADKDLLTPLKLLSEDHGALGRRHIAILPSTISRAARQSLEDLYAIDVATYNLDSRRRIGSNGHGVVGRMVAEWFVRVVDHRGGSRLEDTPVDYAEVLQIRPHLLLPRQRQACLAGLDWLLGCTPRWGPTVGREVRVANISEGLLTLAAVRDAPDLLTPPPPVEEVQTLLRMQDEATGGFVSVTIRSTTPHPHSLAMIALARWRELDPRVPAALAAATAWLLGRLQSDKGGWTRYDGEGDISVVPTLWSFAALASVGRFPADAWAVFRGRLVDSEVVGHGFAGPSSSSAAAGWLLWTAGLLRDHDLMTDADEILVQMAIEQLADPREMFTSESEAVVIARDSISGWRTWLHPTAAAVALGSLQWLDTHEECFGFVGRALAALMQQSSSGSHGRFHDAVMESQDGALTFPTAYATWSLAEATRHLDGRGAIVRLAAVCLERGRLLLVRRKGRRLLTLPSALSEGKDPETTLRDRVRAELGLNLLDLSTWQAFEDRAAFEPDASVRLDTFLGRIDDGPLPSSTNVDLVWHDVMFGDPTTLSPIVRNQVLPAVRSRLFLV